jgi:demethylmenaquinone methyltransferase/2-methoxy-6-polyprenyl-1,4-benzoquinol methylase
MLSRIEAPPRRRLIPDDAGLTKSMADTFYVPGERRAAKVQELFARIARRYDLMNDLQSFGLHRSWKRRLVKLAASQPGQRALDVCCGTGDLALALAGRGAEVVGLDFSEEMLEVARVRQAKLQPGANAGNGDARPGRGESASASRDDRGVWESPKPSADSGSPGRTRPTFFPPRRGEGPSVQFIHGDALRLPFSDDTFDIVTVGYGLRNLEDWEAGLREMARVARPEGRVLVLDFGKPENAVWRGLYFGYLRFFVPLLGLVFCGNARAYTYILESLRQFPAQRGVEEAMGRLGLRKVKVVNLLGGVMSINYGEKGGEHA